MLYTPEEAIAKIREAHESFIGGDGSKTTPDTLAAYAAVIWKVLDFTEKPRATVLLKP